MSFRSDIQKFIISFLIGLAPSILTTGFLVDRLGTIFSWQSEQAFNVFMSLYFTVPFGIMAASLIMLPWKTTLIIFQALFLGVSALLVVLSTQVLGVSFSDFQAIVIVFYVTNLLVVAIAIYIQFRQGQLQWLNEYKPVIFEFAVLSLVLILIGSQFLRTPDKESAIEYRTKSFSQLVSAKADNKTVTVFEQRDRYLKKEKIAATDKPKVEALKKQWTQTVNFAIFRGITLLMLGLGVLLTYWFAFRLHNIRSRLSEEHQNPARLVQNEEGYKVIPITVYEDIPVLKHTRDMILLFTVMVTPIFYTANSKKNIEKRPFVNMTVTTASEEAKVHEDGSSGSSETVKSDTSMVINITKNELIKMLQSHDDGDSTLRYLHAIWEDQRYYQSRFTRGTSANALIRKEDDSDLPTKPKLQDEPLERSFRR